MLKVSLVLLFFLSSMSLAQKSYFEVQHRFNGKKSIPEPLSGNYLQIFAKRKLAIGKYENGKKVGLWIYHNPFTPLTCKGEYRSDNKHGHWSYYSGVVKSCDIYYNMGKVDSAFGYFKSGIRAYELKLSAEGSGYCKSFYENSMMKEEFPIENRQIHGICKLYFDDGRIHRTLEYKNGDEFEVLSTFNFSGEPIDGGSLSNGNGTLIHFHYPKLPNNDSLTRYVVETKVDGISQGEFIIYSKEGFISAKGTNENGRRKGDFTIFDKRGLVLNTFNYDEEYVRLIPSESKVHYTSGLFQNNTTEPEFQGGEAMMQKFIINHVMYPPDAVQRNLSGKVFIQFILNEIGEITSYRIVSKTPQILNDEVRRLILLMPRWSPSLTDGVPQKTTVIIPVVFRLG
jgi:antitoxin component YwqK of YwqJK toxin-antitoxin module